MPVQFLVLGIQCSSTFSLVEDCGPSNLLFHVYRHLKGSQRSAPGISAGDNVTSWIPAAMPHIALKQVWSSTFRDVSLKKKYGRALAWREF